MSKFLLVLVLLTFFSIGGFAAPLAPYTDSPNSCPEADLNKDPKSPLNKIPVYDQDGSGICYSYAAAQMIDFYRFKKGDTSYDLTNPVYASWSTYYKNVTLLKEKSLDDGGYSTDVIKTLRQDGVCSDKEVKTQLRQLTSVSGASEVEVLKFLDVMYKSYDGWFAKKNWSSASSEVSDWTSISCDRQEQLKATLEKKGLFGVAPTEVLSKMFQGCKIQKVNVPDFDTFAMGNDEAIKKPMDKELSKGFPAQVDLCATVFKDPSYRGQRNWSPPLYRYSNGNRRKGCGNHAVMVTGRLNINGSCNYLVRNSWGAYWKPDSATACACKTRNGAYKQICNDPNEVAEYVGCWFDEKNLLPNIGGVSVFK